jgi:hypothetical protein
VNGFLLKEEPTILTQNPRQNRQFFLLVDQITMA